jgi:hypothetical protein
MWVQELCVCVCTRVCVCLWVCTRVRVLYLFHVTFGKWFGESLLLHDKKPCWSAVVASWSLWPVYVWVGQISAQGGRDLARLCWAPYTASSHSHSELGKTGCSKVYRHSFCIHSLSPGMQPDQHHCQPICKYTRVANFVWCMDLIMSTSLTPSLQDSIELGQYHCQPIKNIPE